MGRSQLSLTLIIGLVIVIVLAGFFAIKTGQQKDILGQSSENVVTAGTKQNTLEAFVLNCVRRTSINAEIEYGLDAQVSLPFIKNYISYYLPLCFDDFKVFKEQGYDIETGDLKIDAQITSEALIVDISYPLNFKRDDVLLSFNKQTYTFPRAVYEKINFNDVTRIVSSDGQMQLEIPPGTIATLDGRPLKEVGVKIVDREFDGLENNILSGMLAYKGVPHGVIFSKPVKMIFNYEEKHVPIYFEEENLKMGYFDKDIQIWMGLPTEVDSQKNRVTTFTTHFSEFATVTDCAEGSNGVMVTPTLVRDDGFACDAKWNQDEFSCFDEKMDESPYDLLRKDFEYTNKNGVGIVPVYKEYKGKDSKCFVAEEENKLTEEACKKNEGVEWVRDSELTGAASDSDLGTCHYTYASYDADCATSEYVLSPELAKVKDAQPLTQFCGSQATPSLQGYNTYAIKFVGKGNSCIGLEEAPKGTPATQCGVEHDSGATTFKVEPKCLGTNDCGLLGTPTCNINEEGNPEIDLAMFTKTEEKENTCLLAWAEVTFTGVGMVNAMYQCSTKDAFDFVNGQCSQCISQTGPDGTTAGLYWTAVSDQAKCTCTPSMRGTVREVSGADSSSPPQCQLCSNNGKWENTESDLCNMCEDAELPSTNEEIKDDGTGKVVNPPPYRGLKGILGKVTGMSEVTGKATAEFCCSTPTCPSDFATSNLCEEKSGNCPSDKILVCPPAGAIPTNAPSPTPTSTGTPTATQTPTPSGTGTPSPAPTSTTPNEEQSSENAETSENINLGGSCLAGAVPSAVSLAIAGAVTCGGIGAVSTAGLFGIGVLAGVPCSLAGAGLGGVTGCLAGMGIDVGISALNENDNGDLGDSCDSPDDCSEGLRCEWYSCGNFAQPGEFCNENSDCSTGYTCEFKGWPIYACLDQLGADAECNEPEDCLSGVCKGSLGNKVCVGEGDSTIAPETPGESTPLSQISPGRCILPGTSPADARTELEICLAAAGTDQAKIDLCNTGTITQIPPVSLGGLTTSGTDTGGGGSGGGGNGGGGGGKDENCPDPSAVKDGCEGVDIAPHAGKKVKVDHAIDSRNKNLCDVGLDIAANTDLIIFGAPKTGNGVCWIFVESQQEINGEAPDVYVKYDEIKGLLGVGGQCKEDKDCEEGFICKEGQCIKETVDSFVKIKPIIGFSTLTTEDFVEAKKLDALTVGHSTDSPTKAVDAATANGLETFIIYTGKTFDAAVENEKITGYWLSGDICAEGTKKEDVVKNLIKQYADFRKINKKTPVMMNFDRLDCAIDYIDLDKDKKKFADIILFTVNSEKVPDLDAPDYIIGQKKIAEQIMKRGKDMYGGTLAVIPVVDLSTADGLKDSAWVEKVGKLLLGENEVEINFRGIIYVPWKETVTAAPVIDQEIKVAFVANQKADDTNVLKLIKDEKANLTIHLGGFGHDNAREWNTKIVEMFDKTNGQNDPVPYNYVGVKGTYDKKESWINTDPKDLKNDYSDVFDERLKAIASYETKNKISGGLKCSYASLGLLGYKMTCEYANIFFVLSGVGLMPIEGIYEGHDQFILDSVKREDKKDYWKICGWNRANIDIRVGDIPDNENLRSEYYDFCINNSAIVVTGLESNYARTKTITDLQAASILTTGEPDKIELADKRGLVINSGLLGGQTPFSSTLHGPANWWASMVTPNKYVKSGANVDPVVFGQGALFITFNAGKDKSKAKGEFKAIVNGEVRTLDTFEISKVVIVNPEAPKFIFDVKEVPDYIKAFKSVFKLAKDNYILSEECKANPARCKTQAICEDAKFVWDAVNNKCVECLVTTDCKCNAEVCTEVVKECKENKCEVKTSVDLCKTNHVECKTKTTCEDAKFIWDAANNKCAKCLVAADCKCTTTSCNENTLFECRLDKCEVQST